jgi:hypothetical protein
VFNNKPVWRSSSFVALLSLAYIACNYRFIYGGIFDSTYVSHRTEWALYPYAYASDALGAFQSYFIQIDRYGYSFPHFIIIAILCAALYTIFKNYNSDRVTKTLIIFSIITYFAYLISDFTSASLIAYLIAHGFAIFAIDGKERVLLFFSCIIFLLLTTVIVHERQSIRELITSGSPTNKLGFFSIFFFAVPFFFQNYPLQYPLLQFILIFACILCLLGILWYERKNISTVCTTPTKIDLLYIFAIFVFISQALFASDHWLVTRGIKDLIPAIGAIQIRMYWLAPFFFYVAFALSLKILVEKRAKSIAIVLIIAQMLVLFSSPIATSSLGGQTGGITNMLFDDNYSFKEFYSPEIFEAIDSDIALPKNTYRIGSVGLEPAISQYNGFYTLDGYSNNYPLAYKHEFREIIAPEFEKNQRLKEYFDAYGSQCYFFAAEIAYSAPKTQGSKIENLEFNLTKMEQMGGKYLFSAAPIMNYEAIGLYPFGAYTSTSSPWEVWVYELDLHSEKLQDLKEIPITILDRSGEYKATLALDLKEDKITVTTDEGVKTLNPDEIEKMYELFEWYKERYTQYDI